MAGAASDLFRNYEPRPILAAMQNETFCVIDLRNLRNSEFSAAPTAVLTPQIPGTAQGIYSCGRRFAALVGTCIFRSSYASFRTLDIHFESSTWEAFRRHFFQAAMHSHLHSTESLYY